MKPVRTLVLLTLLLVLLPSPAKGQGFFSRFGERQLSGPLRPGFPERPGGFTFCRLMYRQVRYESGGLGWSTDYPRADRNLTLRLSQLTLASISRWHDDEPGIAVVSALDPNLHRCAFLFTSDAGTAGFNDQEVEALRSYLLKGGFFWVDDFWGNAALAHFSSEIGRALPEYQVVELSRDHPLYSVVYAVQRLPQITALQFWRPGASTSERGAESETPRLYGIMDEHGRLLVLMSHNTDIADGWEREADDRDFFDLFSPDAYALGINVAVWVMTH